MPEMVAPRALVFRPLVKGNEDSGNEIDHTRGSHGRGIKIVHPGFLFHSNESFKIRRLISQESLPSSLKKRYYIYIFLDEIDSRKATCQLSSRHLTAITPGVTLLSKSTHACGRKVKSYMLF